LKKISVPSDVVIMPICCLRGFGVDAVWVGGARLTAVGPAVAGSWRTAAQAGGGRVGSRGARGSGVGSARMVTARRDTRAGGRR
jgi:hypothetical protein